MSTTDTEQADSEQTETEPLVQTIAEAIAAAFTSEYGDRNQQWNPDLPDGPDNSYHLPVPMNERIKQAPYVASTDGDGDRSISTPSCIEIAQAVAAALTNPSAPGMHGSTRVSYGLAHLDKDGQPTAFVYTGDLDGCREVLRERWYDRSGPAPALVRQEVTSVGMSTSTRWTVVTSTLPA